MLSAFTVQVRVPTGPSITTWTVDVPLNVTVVLIEAPDPTVSVLNVPD
jgi:hypothetical protein